MLPEWFKTSLNVAPAHQTRLLRKESALGPWHRRVAPQAVPAGTHRLLHGACRATVSRMLRRAGLSRLSDPAPKRARATLRARHPGELLHIDLKKPGRFDKVGHCITGDRARRARSVGWDFVFVAVGDQHRLAFMQVYPDETRFSAGAFPQAVVGVPTRTQTSAGRLCARETISTTGTGRTTTSTSQRPARIPRCLERAS